MNDEMVHDAVQLVHDCGGSMALENNPLGAHLLNEGLVVEGARDKYGRRTILVISDPLVSWFIRLPDCDFPLPHVTDLWDRIRQSHVDERISLDTWDDLGSRINEVFKSKGRPDGVGCFIMVKKRGVPQDHLTSLADFHAETRADFIDADILGRYKRAVIINRSDTNGNGLFVVPPDMSKLVHIR